MKKWVVSSNPAQGIFLLHAQVKIEGRGFKSCAENLFYEAQVELRFNKYFYNNPRWCIVIGVVIKLVPVFKISRCG